MEFELEQAKDILRRTPATLEALLRGLPAEWLGSNEGPDTWSPLDVLGHLIHGEEEDWIPRAKIILQHGESSAFEPFDRFAYLERESTKGKGLADLLATFETLRAENLAALDELDLDNDNRLALLGTHPEFGRVTLGQLIATWATHDLAHIVQIARVLARQYDTAVGPWKEYLSVLH
jgi:DinB family protein